MKHEIKVVSKVKKNTKKSRDDEKFKVMETASTNKVRDCSVKKSINQ